MKSILPILFSLAGLTASSQSIAGLNFNYWYDPNAQVEFALSPVKASGYDLIYYRLFANRKESPIDSYSIAWESRTSLGEKNVEVLKVKDSVISKEVSLLVGCIRVPTSTKLWYVLAKVTNTSTQEFFHYYKVVDPLWPVNNLLIQDGKPVQRNYVSEGNSFSLAKNPGKPVYGFLYKTVFPNALPAFAEALRIDPFLKADSTFVVGNNFAPKSKGLYLFQEDTTAAQGISFLVTDKNYPKFTSIALLAAPFVYITTDDEYNQLLAAKSDKPAFDKVILEITRDKERAKNLMRSYFQRVEMSNRYFTDFKEGWKTDRGMVYTIYGIPDEVSRTESNEIWFYRAQKSRFVFNKSGSVFSPENYKLERNYNYKESWFSTVDLWRKSRF